MPPPAPALAIRERNRAETHAAQDHARFFRCAGTVGTGGHSDVAITTDIIVGFPGETEAEFSETVEFVKSMNFAGGHVFTYSARPGTPAARMNTQVRHEIRKERNAVLRAVLEELARAYRSGFIGQTLPVLWEGSSQLIMP